MHLLVIFLQYLLGRFLNKPQPQPVPIPARTPNAQAAPDRQAFESTNDPPGRTSAFYRSTETGTSVPGLGRSDRNSALWAIAFWSAACLGAAGCFGVGCPENSSPLSALRVSACAGNFSPEMRA